MNAAFAPIPTEATPPSHGARLVTHHNIARSEAFSTRPVVLVRELPRRPRRFSPLALYVAAPIAGVVIGLIDAALKQPICVSIVVLAFVVAWLRG
ncbi:hypothetical protein [Brevundimonas diminuta]|uniref:hypothetical protein n=1 Tax=Brevundimonas diminuta TaxID=293 RepID=UPI00145EB5DB|nr:hypothetical protein [Brevundimonas diminuta]